MEIRTISQLELWAMQQFLHLKCMAVVFSLCYLRKFPPSCAYLALKIQVLPWSSHKPCRWQDSCPWLGEAPQHWVCAEQVAHIWGINGGETPLYTALEKPGKVKHTTYPFKGIRWLTPHCGILGLNAISILVIFCCLRSHTTPISPRSYVLLIPDSFPLNLGHRF